MILLVGGSCSGKTEWASQVFRAEEKILYLSPVKLSELPPPVQSRAQRQARLRPKNWVVVEPEFEWDKVLSGAENEGFSGVIVDSVNLWLGRELTRLFDRYDLRTLGIHCRKELQHLFEQLAKLRMPAIVVSGEVGAGVTPPHESGRLFQDLVAEANLQVAQRADLVGRSFAGQVVALKYPGSLLPETGEAVFGQPALVISPQDARKVLEHVSQNRNLRGPTFGEGAQHPKHV